MLNCAECYLHSSLRKDSPYATTFGGIRMKVSLSIESIFWNLRPPRPSLTAHVPKFVCISGFPRKPPCETHDCNWGWVGNGRRFPNHPVHLKIFLRTIDRRHTGGLRRLEGSRLSSQRSGTRALG